MERASEPASEEGTKAKRSAIGSRPPTCLLQNKIR
jgi:hypothetical protein